MFIYLYFSWIWTEWKITASTQPGFEQSLKLDRSRFISRSPVSGQPKITPWRKPATIFFSVISLQFTLKNFPIYSVWDDFVWRHYGIVKLAFRHFKYKSVFSSRTFFANSPLFQWEFEAKYLYPIEQTCTFKQKHSNNLIALANNGEKKVCTFILWFCPFWVIK